MALAPIVQIAIDDSEFKRFSAAFDEYLSKVKSMPADWQATHASIGKLAQAMRASGASAERSWSGAVDLATKYERAIRTAATAEQHLGRGAGAASTALARMEKHAKGIASDLFSAVRSMARFATFSIGGGLLGLGGLAFGLDRLADAVLNRQRSARGFGISPGELASFNVNFSRVAGTNVLAGAAEAQMDVAKAGALSMLGINQQLASRESATVLAGQEILALHNRLRGVPTSQLMNTAAAIGAGQLGFSAEDIRRIHLTPAATLRADMARTAAQAPSLGFSAQVAREWSQFSMELRRAGLLIESALIKTLAPLAPQLDLLSKNIAAFIVSLEKSGELKQWINDLSIGIHDFAMWIGSPVFKQDMATFARDVAGVADGLYRALVWLGLIPRGPATTAQLGVAQTTPAPRSAADLAGAIAQRAEINARRGRGEYTPQAISALIVADSKKYGVPVGLMSRLATVESGFGQAGLASPKGALGVFQVMPETGRDLGLGDMLDPQQNAEAASRYMAMLLKKYHGDQAEAVAAYNWGPANVDSDIARHGADWLRYAPAETRSEVARVVPGTRLPPAAPRGPAPAAPGMHPGQIFPGGSFRAEPSLAPGTLPAPAGPAPAPERRGAATSPGGVQSDTARVRARYWANRQHAKVTVQNNTSSQVFVSTNAAAQ